MSQILLIEPNRILAKLYAEALRYAGHRVMTAADAQVAINAADERTPEVVIMEIQLAAHNGLEFLYEFRSYPEWQKVPVIIHSLVPPGQLVLDSGPMEQLNIVAYLYKPQTGLDKLLRSLSLVQSLTIER